MQLHSCTKIRQPTASVGPGLRAKTAQSASLVARRRFDWERQNLGEAKLGRVKTEEVELGGRPDNVHFSAASVPGWSIVINLFLSFRVVHRESSGQEFSGCRGRPRNSGQTCLAARPLSSEPRSPPRI